VTNVWDDRAEAYRKSPDHASGDDLDLLVEWCEPSGETKILDAATGAGTSRGACASVERSSSRSIPRRGCGRT
jgi:tRNA1(Val) A37 N6-methylase TrmN6